MGQGRRVLGLDEEWVGTLGYLWGLGGEGIIWVRCWYRAFWRWCGLGRVVGLMGAWMRGGTCVEGFDDRTCEKFGKTRKEENIPA